MAGEFQEATRLSDSTEQKPRDQNPSSRGTLRIMLKRLHTSFQTNNKKEASPCPSWKKLTAGSLAACCGIVPPLPIPSPSMNMSLAPLRRCFLCGVPRGCASHRPMMALWSRMLLMLLRWALALPRQPRHAAPPPCRKLSRTRHGQSRRRGRVHVFILCFFLAQGC